MYSGYDWPVVFLSNLDKSRRDNPVPLALGCAQLVARVPSTPGASAHPWRPCRTGANTEVPHRTCARAHAHAHTRSRALARARTRARAHARTRARARERAHTRAHARTRSAARRGAARRGEARRGAVRAPALALARAAARARAYRANSASVARTPLGFWHKAPTFHSNPHPQWFHNFMALSEYAPRITPMTFLKLLRAENLAPSRIASSRNRCTCPKKKANN